MIDFQRFVLNNGLTVLVHEDHSTPMVAVNVLYKVGSRDESIDKTGFAHLFEHLMFGGSENIPHFDEPIQMAGGDSNAFTNNDITNFYDVLPAENLETAFWLESDRMYRLNFSHQSLDIQRKVVIEEFKETCLTQPYGDAWHHLLEIAYEVHPYRWPTIGKTPEHIENATLEDVEQFFYQYYRPNNAVLVVSGNCNIKTVQTLSEKWFGDIERGKIPTRNLPQEPVQTTFHHRLKEDKVPVDALFMAFHAPSRIHADYHTVDLLSDVLSNGQSSRLYRRLLKKRSLFSEIDAYITGSLDPGLLIIEGKPAEGVSLETAEAAVWAELELLKKAPISVNELQKLKNKIESTLIFSEANILTKAMNLAFFEVLGDPNLINEEPKKYQAVTPIAIQQQAQLIFRKENCSELYYKAI